MRLDRMNRTLGWAVAILAVVAVPATAHDWDDCGGWDEDSDWGSKGRYCEIREMTLPATGSVAVDAGRNGGIRVTGADQNQVDLEVRIQVWGRSKEKAISHAKEVKIHTDGGRIRADGPSDDWSVSFRVRVPHQTDLDLEAHNGGISIEEVNGRLRAETHNGGLSLASLSGDVLAETTNGGVRVDLLGDQWEGRGLNVETRNGGVKVSIPENYSAELETGTVNGRINIEFPVTVQGQIGRDIETTLGSGGAPVRVRTKNGSVTITKS
jgi:DUF4097 and DUF4098 domain-containing protein YvlB